MIRSALHILRHHLTFGRAVNILTVLSAYLLSLLLRRPFCFGRPFMLMIEPSNLCNLNCPLCPTGSDTLTRARGQMTVDQFHRLIDELGDHLLFLSLWNMGEPFMNRHFTEMVRYAKSKNIYVITSTNGHFFTDTERVRDLVSSGLDECIISIDGASQETYTRYRRKGNLKIVIDGIPRLVREKERQDSSRPLIDPQFLVMRHNEHERETIERLARDLRVNRLSLKTVQVNTEEEASTFLPVNPELRRYSLHNGQFRMKGRLRNMCRWLWFCPVINWDGSVVPCCFDKDNDLALGTLEPGVSFSHIWKNEAYTRLRRRILTSREGIDLCRNCSEGLKSLYLKRERIR